MKQRILAGLVLCLVVAACDVASIVFASGYLLLVAGALAFSAVGVVRAARPSFGPLEQASLVADVIAGGVFLLTVLYFLSAIAVLSLARSDASSIGSALVLFVLFGVTALAAVVSVALHLIVNVARSRRGE